MFGHRTTVGVCLFCVLALSAVLAGSASAATKGTTLFTCKTGVGGAGFSKSHCKDVDAVPIGAAFEHVAVAENTTTEITGTTEDTGGNPTPTKLESIVAGVSVAIESPSSHIVEGWVTNAKDPSTGEHYWHGEAVVKDTNVIVIKPSGKGCKVKGGEITSKRLKLTTKGQGMEVKVEPAEGTLWSSFEMEGCSIAALNGLYELKGSAKASPDGATLNFGHAAITTQSTLTLRGQKAGIEAGITVKGTDKAAGDVTDTPLSTTTIETP